MPHDYHLECAGIAYSVPYRYIRKQVDLRATITTVEMFYDGHSIASHPRGEKVGSSVTEPKHMPRNHRAWRAVDEANLGLWAEDFGPAVQAVVAVEIARGYRGTVRQKRYKGFADLARNFDKERFESACARALAIGNPELPHIRNILENGLDAVPISKEKKKKPPSVHNNVRGAGYFNGGSDHV